MTFLRSTAPRRAEVGQRAPVGQRALGLRSAGLAVVALLILVQPAWAKAPPESFADLAEKLLPAVVNISTTQTVESRRGPDMPQLPPGSPFEDFFKDFFEERNRQNGGPRQPRRAQSLGSGFLIDPSGIVVTNNHVIAEADEVMVRLQDDEEFEAEVLGRDPKTDIAVLKIDPKGRDLPFVEFGDSDALRVGDWVVAIGNPFGLGGTVTAGIVSARKRDIRQGPYDDFIQTDASINKGNSGGPLFDLNGKVIGVNTAIFSQTGGSVGIGFAVSARLAGPVVDQLREYGRTRRGWLGVRIQTVDEDIARSLGLEEATGALVADVTDGGPAKDAGIEPGDVILSFNNEKVESMRQLPRIVAETRIGIDVPVEVWRKGARKLVTARIGELEKAEQAQLIPASRTVGEPEETERMDFFGLELSSLTEDLRKEHDIDGETKGVVITGIDFDRLNTQQKVSVGAVIVEVEQQPVSSPKDVAELAKAAKEKGLRAVLLEVDDNGTTSFISLRFNEG